MYVEILARSDDNEESKGKKSWLNTGLQVPAIELLSAKGKRQADWHVRLKASDWRLQGTGDLGGETRATKYAVRIDFTSDDLVAIVDFALKNSLVRVVPGKVA